jgi:hypothetical protein
MNTYCGVMLLPATVAEKFQVTINPVSIDKSTVADVPPRKSWKSADPAEAWFGML